MEAAQRLRTFGANDLDVPLPELSTLLQEQAVAPFFLFQVLCCVLWMLDEYWQYSVITLAMIVLLEVRRFFFSIMVCSYQDLKLLLYAHPRQEMHA